MLWNKNKINNSVKGFTLVETLIYIAIIGGVIGTFVSFSLNISNTGNKTYSQQEVQANARVAMDMIVKKIKSASSVSTTQSVFGVNPGVLYLTMSSSTLNPTIINLSGVDGQLQIKEGVASTTSITTKQVEITSLIFSNLSASSSRENISVNLTVSYATSTDVGYKFSQSLQTTASLRE